jgi:hypothetical protein
MRRAIAILLLVCISGCAGLSKNSQSETNKLLNDLQAQVSALKIQQDRYEASQKQIIATTREILRMLSELYQEK